MSLPLSYKKLSSKLLSHNPSVKTSYKKFRLPNGLTEEFYVEENKNSVCIVAFTEDKHLVCVEQFRPSSEKLELEIPGGGIETNEDPKKAAQRELREETGFGGSEFVFLGAVRYSPYSTGKRFMYCVPLAERIKSSLDLDPNEFVKVKLMPLELFLERLRGGEAGSLRGSDAVAIALAMGLIDY